jgi:hypothetical protein
MITNLNVVPVDGQAPDVIRDIPQHQASSNAELSEGLLEVHHALVRRGGTGRAPPPAPGGGRQKLTSTADTIAMRK